MCGTAGNRDLSLIEREEREEREESRFGRVDGTEERKEGKDSELICRDINVWYCNKASTFCRE